MRRRFACVQTAPVFGEVETNLDHVEGALQGLQADLVVLPELFATGYAFRDAAELRALAEPFPAGATTQRLLSWSERLGGVLVGGFPERDGDRVFNAAAVVAAGRPLGCYRKIHLFGFEHELYAAGDRPLEVHEHEGMRVGTMVCFDWFYPEAARVLALQGADVIAHPSNLVLPYCQQAMPTRALENRVFTVTTNRVGREEREPRPRLAFTGASLVCAPSGATIGQASTYEEATFVVEAELDNARNKTLKSGNDPMVERRPDFYGAITDANPRDA